MLVGTVPLASINVTRDPQRVADDHLEAVRSGNPVAMAADYATHATLERGDEVYTGRSAIEAYFRTVPDRLGDARVVFDDVSVDDDVVTFRWHLDGGGASVSGTDVCTVAEGLITHQTVHLDGTDF